jgi:hypothetical protein
MYSKQCFTQKEVYEFFKQYAELNHEEITILINVSKLLGVANAQNDTGRVCLVKTKYYQASCGMPVLLELND